MSFSLAQCVIDNGTTKCPTKAHLKVLSLGSNVIANLLHISLKFGITF